IDRRSAHRTHQRRQACARLWRAGATGFHSRDPHLAADFDAEQFAGRESRLALGLAGTLPTRPTAAFAMCLPCSSALIAPRFDGGGNISQAIIAVVSMSIDKMSLDQR